MFECKIKYLCCVCSTCCYSYRWNSSICVNRCSWCSESCAAPGVPTCSFFTPCSSLFIFSAVITSHRSMSLCICHFYSLLIHSDFPTFAFPIFPLPIKARSSGFYSPGSSSSGNRVRSSMFPSSSTIMSQVSVTVPDLRNLQRQRHISLRNYFICLEQIWKHILICCFHICIAVNSKRFRKSVDLILILYTSFL